MQPVSKPQPRKIKMRSIATIKEEAMQWLWYPYFPYGNVTLIFGRGGIGKSHIALDIAARLSRGEPMPTGEGENDHRPEPQRVLILAAEDDAATVIRPRLTKLNAQLENVYVPEEFFDLSVRGMADFEGLVDELDPALIIIDPVVAYLGGKVDMNRANEVRVFMGALMEIAKSRGIAVLLVHHKKKGKSDEGDEADLAMGSVDFNNAVRSSVFVTPGNTGVTLMQHVKHNYSPKGATMAFQIDPEFTWGAASGTREAPGRPAAQRHNAQEFIHNALREGPVPAKEIERMAEAAGINSRTLARAKVGVAESFLVLGDGGNTTHVWWWRLIGWKPKTRVAPVAGSAGGNPQAAGLTPDPAFHAGDPDGEADLPRVASGGDAALSSPAVALHAGGASLPAEAPSAGGPVPGVGGGGSAVLAGGDAQPAALSPIEVLRAKMKLLTAVANTEG